MTELNYKIRPGNEEDHPFVHSTLLKSFESSSLAKSLGGGYYRIWAPLVRRLVPLSDLLIAHDSEDENLILGWLLHNTSSKLLHYIYVREPFRGVGMASALLHSLATVPSVFPDLSTYTATHRTLDSQKITSEWARVGMPIPSYDFTKVLVAE